MHNAQHLQFYHTVLWARCVLAKLTPQLYAIQRVATKPNSLQALKPPWHSHVPVCLFEQLSCSFVVYFCMQQRQRWWEVVLCLWSNASARAQYKCEKLRHANCQWEEGGSGIKRWRRGHINTQLQAGTHSNTALPNLISDTVSWLVLINQFKKKKRKKRDHIGGVYYAAHQLSDDIILSETGLLNLVSDSVQQWLLPHQHP